MDELLLYDSILPRIDENLTDLKIKSKKYGTDSGKTKFGNRQFTNKFTELLSGIIRNEKPNVLLVDVDINDGIRVLYSPSI